MQLPEEAHCSLCGCPGPFAPVFPGASLRETRCPGCSSSRRTRDLVRVLMRTCLREKEFFSAASSRKAWLSSRLEELKPLRIYELQAQGALHAFLKELPAYVCSEYFTEIPPGERTASGVQCQDAHCLTFADAGFDVVISQDVMEHMENPWQGFKEINRVLRPGGLHIFTVPLHEGQPSRPRARRLHSGGIEFLLPPVRHKDPLNREGALVFWDYGDDLPELLAKHGIAARKALHTHFYRPEDICSVPDEESHARYLRACATDGPASFFFYNSVVFVGERKE